jgi:hypothetical protein
MLSFPTPNKRVLTLRDLLKQSTLGFIWASLLLLSLVLAWHLQLNLKQTNITEVVILAREGLA